MTKPTTRTVLQELIAAAKLTSEGREFPLGHLDDVRESAEQHLATLSDASDDGNTDDKEIENKRLRQACVAALRYNNALEQCANDPNKMTSHCTVDGDRLNILYEDFVNKSSAALQGKDIITDARTEALNFVEPSIDWQRRYEDIKCLVVKQAGSPATLATVLLLLFKQHRQEK